MKKKARLVQTTCKCWKTLSIESFAKLHEDMDTDGVKGTIKDIEENLSSVQEDVESLKEPVKNTSDTIGYNIDVMKKRILDLEKQVKLQTERNTKLKQYKRRGNLRFNNIKGMEKEYCKATIYDILQRDLELDTSLNKIPCGSSGRKTNAGKNKTDYSALRKPRGRKLCLGETKQN